MSAINPGGYGRMDVATFTSQFPRVGGDTATVQRAGIPVPTDLAATAPAGNPSFPWLGLVVALFALRVVSHFRKE